LRTAGTTVLGLRRAAGMGDSSNLPC